MGNRQFYTNADQIDAACRWVGLPDETVAKVLAEWRARERFELWRHDLPLLEPKKGDILYDGQLFMEVTSVKPARVRFSWKIRGEATRTGKHHGLVIPRDRAWMLKQALEASARANPEIEHTIGGNSDVRLFNLVTAVNVLRSEDPFAEK